MTPSMICRLGLDGRDWWGVPTCRRLYLRFAVRGFDWDLTGVSDLAGRRCSKDA